MGWGGAWFLKNWGGDSFNIKLESLIGRMCSVSKQQTFEIYELVTHSITLRTFFVEGEGSTPEGAGYTLDYYPPLPPTPVRDTSNSGCPGFMFLKVAVQTYIYYSI